MASDTTLRVLIVGKNASWRMGGEASLAMIYFDRLRRMGIETWLLAHHRSERELRETLGPAEFARVYFVPDTAFNRWIWKIEKYVPEKIGDPVFDTTRSIESQRIQRKMAKRLVKELGITVVHETSPISAKRPSAMFGVGAPVVVGPLCGGMSFPPAFRHMHGRVARTAEIVARGMTGPLNWLMPGKLRAAAVLVANEQTKQALPWGIKGKIYQVVESGVDLDVWEPVAEERATEEKQQPARFAFFGRLVPYKGPDLALLAFKRALMQQPEMELQFVGDGVMRPKLEEQAQALGIANRVTFTGYISRTEAAERLRQANAMILPSLRECGGSVILESFAVGVPVITAHWGGPGIYVDDTTGIRVRPDSQEGFIQGFADAMVKLANDKELRERMSTACLARARSHYFDWESKINRLLEIYREAMGRGGIIASLSESEEKLKDGHPVL